MVVFSNGDFDERRTPAGRLVSTSVGNAALVDLLRVQCGADRMYLTQRWAEAR